jgi:hypothetical protein
MGTITVTVEILLNMLDFSKIAYVRYVYEVPSEMFLSQSSTFSFLIYTHYTKRLVMILICGWYFFIFNVFYTPARPLLR